jgi:hypothetical protein
VRKKSFAPLILCLLAIGVLSNRLFILRQFTVKPNQAVTVRLPSNSTAPSKAQPRSLLPPLSSEAAPELEESLRSGIAITTDATGTVGERSTLPTLQTRLSATPPTYILQSVLNL